MKWWRKVLRCMETSTMISHDEGGRFTLEKVSCEGGAPCVSEGVLDRSMEEGASRPASVVDSGSEGTA